ncbi:hypothetical protein LO762_21715 [Actinocorallia sp. API 0066]|uniref:hypothetical protein n=1 Tax=Actinocorallia sp. API 0066 TaxID=2896846 RepID=UPI001E40C4A9|nr:hypothetical protein [Actinocorallia sp. API 0066]MCD0451792.1 hypothetical protein [Actinocorallia sp. API 0066]
MRSISLVITLFVALVVTALGPTRLVSEARALAAAPAPLNTPFLPASAPMRVTIASLTAVNLSVTTNVTIRLADNTTVTTNRYTFQKLSLNSNTVITSNNGTSTVTVRVPGYGSLGGTDSAGKPQTTVMWGNISRLCVTVILQICGIQGLLNFFGSLIPLTAGASGFIGDIYAIRTMDDHAELSETQNPVHLPGSLTVTTP